MEQASQGHRPVTTARYSSPLGELVLAGEGDCLTGLWFDGQPGVPAWPSQGASDPALPVLDQTRAWLDCYFSGKAPDFTPPIRLSGTPFQLEVWALLRAIPYGQTTTYGRLAAALAEKRGVAHMSAQAVGGAVGKNPVSILVPCHRVLGAAGSLTGYAGGLERKAALLRLEGALTE